MTGSLVDAINSIHIIANNDIVQLNGTWRLTGTGEKLSYAPVNYNHLINVRGENHLIHPHDVEIIAGGSHLKSNRLTIKLINCEGEVHLLEGDGINIQQHEHGAAVVTAEQENAPLRSKYEAAFPDEDERRKKAVEEQIDGGNILEAVFNTSTLGLHVLQSIRDQRGEIVDFNILLTNATSDRIAGRKVGGMRMLEGWPHTRDIGLFEKFIEVVKTGGKLQYEHFYEGDGVKAWFQWIASKLGDGLYVTIEDITERKKAEISLGHTVARLQSIFDGVPAVIVLLDVIRDEAKQPVDFVITAINKAGADLAGHQSADLIGKSLTDSFPRAVSDSLKESHIKVFNTGEHQQMEYLFPGTDRWFSISVTRQVDGEGIVVAAVEITAQKNSEEQRRQNQILAELNEAKTDFFSNISHEFRTPLTLMLAPMQDVIKKLRTTSTNREELGKLELVYRNALRLEKLVNTLLHFSAIEAGRSDAVFKPIDIAEFTALIAGNFRSAIENAGIKFLVDCESTEAVYVNPDMWEKIVLNLLSNAFKFTFTGKIEVRLRSLKKRIKLEVSDTGIGINPSDHEKIFERFARIPNAKSRSHEGSGIGLALVSELVKIHGGTIEVKSRSGEGSVFSVSLLKGKEHLPPKNVHEITETKSLSPLGSIYAQEAAGWLMTKSDRSKTTDNSIPASPDVSNDPLDQKTRHIILLVDDNADVREYVKSLFRSGYAVATAHNGVQAMELIHSGLRPDVILADVMMPEMDGYTFLKKIRENDWAEQTHFIMLSARASEEDRIFGLRSGVDDYLVKPFSSESLLALVNARVRRNKRQQGYG